MAVPKRKASKSRRNKRKANWKAEKPTLTECSQCHQMKLPHHVCPECGHYNGEKITEVE